MATLFALLLVMNVHAQQMLDVIKTKKGDVKWGHIIYQDAEKIKIKTDEGDVFVYRHDEIESTTQQENPPVFEESDNPSEKLPPTPPHKGSMMVSTATGLAGGGNNAGFSYNNSDGVKTSSFSLLPNAGYFFDDGFLGGMSIVIASTKEKEGKVKRTNSAFIFGPFVRYYGTMPVSKNLYWTGEAGIGLGLMKRKVKTGSNVSENVDGLLSFSLGPGMALFLHQRLSVEVQAVYERIRVKDKENDFKFSQGTVGLRLGFGVFL